MLLCEAEGEELRIQPFGEGGGVCVGLKRCLRSTILEAPGSIGLEVGVYWVLEVEPGQEGVPEVDRGWRASRGTVRINGVEVSRAFITIDSSDQDHIAYFFTSLLA